MIAQVAGDLLGFMGIVPRFWLPVIFCGLWCDVGKNCISMPRVKREWPQLYVSTFAGAPV